MARILLDENLDWRLRRYLPGQVVESVALIGWAGLKNSELLERAESRFHIFVTMDSNLAHQLNLTDHNIALFVLKAKSNRLVDTVPLMSEVLSKIDDVQPGTLITLAV